MTTHETITVPDLTLNATNDKQINLKDFAGKNIVLYFYPKDSTPGCTLESKAFSEHMDEFAQQNTVIFGVSRDSIASHEKFKAKHCMPFELLSDNDEALCHHFNVIAEKSMFGKRYMGLVRSTFLIDTEGNVVREWRKVKVRGHVKEVLEAVKSLS